MVARPTALRVSQPMPWRARTGSVDSESSLFYPRDMSVGIALQEKERAMLYPYQYPFSTQVLNGDFGGSCHCDCL